MSSVAQIRKALVATAAAFLTGFAPAWAQAGGFPGWSTVGGLAIFAAVAGLTTWAVPNARPPLPKVASHLTGPPAPPVSARDAADLRARIRAGRPGRTLD